MRALLKVNISNKKKYNEGKTKDIFKQGRNKLFLFFTDRISADDILMAEGIPQKGMIQCEISRFWLEFINKKKIIRTHFIGQPDLKKIKGHVIWKDGDRIIFQNIREVPHKDLEKRLMVVKKIDKIIPLRFIVKGYAVEEKEDSIFQELGVKFDDPFVEILARSDDLNGKVCYIEAGMVIKKWMVKNGFKKDPFDVLEFLIAKAKEIYTACSEFSIKKGVVIAEAKFEFGFDGGDIVLVDEVLNPDCARFWLEEDFRLKKLDELYDKRILIKWLKEKWWTNKCPPPRLSKEIIAEISSRYEVIRNRIFLNPKNN